MNWAKQRAEEIVEQLLNDWDLTTREVIATELQRVADECVSTAQNELLIQPTEERRFVAERLAHNLRARFPKEEA